MRSLVLERFGQMVVADRPEPRLGPDDVLVRVDFAGICGTDVHGFTGANGRREEGQVMGHEFSGRVVACGDAAPRRVLGATVTVNPLLSCATCRTCRDGFEQQCSNRIVLGVDPSVPAAFAEFVAVPAEAVHPLPAGLPLREAALVEPLAVGLHAVRRAPDVRGRVVLVVGGGPIGQSAVIAASHGGASHIMVSEPSASRRAVCRGLGVEVIDPTTVPLADAVGASAHGLADVVVDAVGVRESLRDAVASSRAGATIVVVGMGATSVDLGLYPLVTQERALVGSYCYSQRSFRDALQLAVDADQLLASIVSEVVDLEAAPDAFARLAVDASIGGKVLIDIGGGR